MMGRREEELRILIDPISIRAKSIEYSGIRRMVALADGLNDVISFAIGEPDYDIPENVRKAATGALEKGQTHYGPTAGLLAFRDAVSKKLHRENGVDYDPKTEVLATVGATEACFSSILSIVNPNDEVIITDPGFVFYAPTIILAGGKPVLLPIFEANDFTFSGDDLKKLITPKTKVIWLNSPHNPTGSVMSRSQLQEVADIAIERDILVVSDEVYEKFVYDGNEHVSIASLPGMRERTLTVNALSKTYAMTGLRLGFVAAPEKMIERIHLVHMHICTHPSVPAQIAGVEALNGPQNSVNEMVEEFSRRREVILKRLNEIEGISSWRVKGSFYVFPDISQFMKSSREFAEELLREARVNSVPGTAFGGNGEGYLRLSFAAPIPTINEGMDRLERFAIKVS